MRKFILALLLSISASTFAGYIPPNSIGRCQMDLHSKKNYYVAVDAIVGPVDINFSYLGFIPTPGVFNYGTYHLKEGDKFVAVIKGKPTTDEYSYVFIMNNSTKYILKYTCSY